MTYEDKSWDFEVYYRDLWEWAADLLRDPRLFPHLTFDAQRLSKFDGEKFVRFIDEPYTADAFWDLQVCIRAVPTMLCFQMSCLLVAIA
jgi:hypothetical protein